MTRFLSLIGLCLVLAGCYQEHVVNYSVRLPDQSITRCLLTVTKEWIIEGGTGSMLIERDTKDRHCEPYTIVGQTVQREMAVEEFTFRYQNEPSFRQSVINYYYQ